jgi:hypothetical protein
MRALEISLPIRCPVCLQESLTHFRVEVVSEALETGDIRLYANCHVVAWDASAGELARIRDFLRPVQSENAGARRAVQRS